SYVDRPHLHSFPTRRSSDLALEMDICFETLNEWRKEKTDFSEAIKKAIRHSQGWWERLGRVGASGQHEINPTVYIFNMKNRFKDDWRDKQEIDNNHKVEVIELQTKFEKSK